MSEGQSKDEIAIPELHPVPVVSPWYHLGIDFVGPFHTPSKQENRYILTIADYFSKFVQAIPCRTKEANMCIDNDYVRDLLLFMKFGISKVITTDQGSEFNNKLDSELMTHLNVDHHLTTPYHPQIIILYIHV